MGAFVDAVRRGGVKGPQQRGFNADTWKKALQATASDEADKLLGVSGEWFAEEFTKLRHLTLEYASKADPARADEITLGFATQQWAVVKNKVRAAFEKIVQNKEFISEQLSEMRIANVLGASFDPEVAVEAIVDGARYPLSYQFAEQKSAGVSAEEHLSAAAMMFTLGGYYHTLEQWWLECLWNDYSVAAISDDLALVAPADAGFHKVQAISRFRQEARHQEAVTQSAAWLQKAPDELLNKIFASRHSLSSFKRKGKTHIKPVPLTKANVGAGTAARVMLTHEYLEPLYRKARRQFRGLTLAQLLDAVELLSALPNQMYKFLPGRSELRSLDEILRYVVRVDANELRQCFVKALRITDDQATWLLEYFTFPRNVREQLWFKPLVRLNENAIGMLAPALDGVNFTRLVDHLVNTIDDLEQEAGTLFETHVRSELIESASDFRFKHRLGIVNSAFTFSVDSKFEEIDLIYALGNNIFIGEDKAIGFPSSSLQVFQYTNRIRMEAIPQAQRKAEFVRNHLRAFLKATGLEETVDEGAANVHSVVVTNGVFLSGFEIDGVPVTDLLILTKYFREGYLAKFGYRDERGKLVAARKDVFYDNEQQAIDNHVPYLRNPPQVAVFEPYVTLDDIKYPSALKGFRSLVIRAYQMHMPYDDVRAEINKHRSSRSSAGNKAVS
jgi:hypothetical protein